MTIVTRSKSVCVCGERESIPRLKSPEQVSLMRHLRVHTKLSPHIRTVTVKYCHDFVCMYVCVCICVHVCMYFMYVCLAAKYHCFLRIISKTQDMKRMKLRKLVEILDHRVSGISPLINPRKIRFSPRQMQDFEERKLVYPNVCHDKNIFVFLRSNTEYRVPCSM
jgi:hypothetical protein